MLNEQELIACFEHTLSPAERARVEVELERDPQLRAELVRQSQLDHALRAALGSTTANERVKQSVLAVIRGEQESSLKGQILADTANLRPQPSVLAWLFSMLRRPAFGLSFAGALALLVVWFVQRPAAIATGIELPTRLELAGSSTPPKRGEAVRAPANSSATVKFADGTTLNLEPGTEISFVSVDRTARSGGKQLKLLAGSISAAVAKQPEGLPLLIQTPHAHVTVVGTEFDLSVATNQTALEVTHGLVKMNGNGETNPVSVAAGEFAVAAEKTPLRYGRLARHPFLWPFSSASIWNRPLGSEAKFSPVPGKTFLADGPLTHALRPRRPILGSPADPLRRIWVDGEARTDARLAEANLPGENISDSWVLLQPGRRYALELRGVTGRADGDLEVQALARTDLAGPGADESASGAKPFGLSNLGGLLRQGELENGIRHALSCRIPRPQLGGRHDFQTPSTVWPATGGDAASAEFLNIGTLLAIPPDVDIAAKFGTNGPAHALARAMQDYGVYVTGVAPAPFVLLTDGANHSHADEWLNQLVPLLQVVTNNSPATTATPRREAAPELMPR